MAASGGLGQLGVPQVAVRGVADDLGVLLQRGQGAVSEVAGEGLGGVGKEDFHRANSAGRFSLKARMPSRWSPAEKHSTFISFS